VTGEMQNAKLEKMKNHTITLLLVAAVCGLASCATKPRSASPGFDDGIVDNDIPRSRIPSHVMAAAKAEIPGFALEEADLVQRAGTRLFELQGYANNRPCEIDITADGRVLHVERD
jgi:hypothetical protein